MAGGDILTGIVKLPTNKKYNYDLAMKSIGDLHILVLWLSILAGL